MQLPQLNVLPTERMYTQEFLGYNHNLRIGDGEFYDTKNLTTDYYPLASTRAKRAHYNWYQDVHGMIIVDNVKYIVSGENLIISDGINLEESLPLELSDKGMPAGTSNKCMVRMGNQIVIFPDKICYDITNSSIKSLEKVFTGEDRSGKWKFTMSDIEGTEYNYTKSKTAPKSPENGTYWLDTSQEKKSLKVYSESTNSWTSVTANYIKITSLNIGQAFRVGDGVTISGFLGDRAWLNGTHVVLATPETSTSDGSKTHHNSIVVTGTLDENFDYSRPIVVERRVPDFDFVIESGNRLWGCRYGTQLDDNGARVKVNEIYASKLGDPTNWHVFEGTSTDSYTVSVGSEGPFTGAAVYSGHPVFFKENWMHSVHGTLPSNFQVSTAQVSGVQNLCHKSTVVVNNVLYYKSANGIMAYDGSVPVNVSDALGNIEYSYARAGAARNKYYVDMADENGVWHLFVYDTKRRLWMHEDNTDILLFCRGDRKDKTGYDSGHEELYFMRRPPQGAEHYGEFDLQAMYATEGSTSEELGDDPRINWMFQTGEIGYSLPDKKYISRFNIRMRLASGARANVFVQYDSCGKWVPQGSLTGKHVQSYTMPIIPRRCDHMAIRVEGKGDMKLYSISKILEQGSDV